MREIKFRCWDFDEKRFTEADYMPTCPFDSTSTIFSLDSNDEYCFQQFTGLHDRNGREIYEGDIVSFEDFYIGDHRQVGGNGVVKFVDDGWDVFAFNEPQAGLWDMVNNCGAEVIGNIYESPELLK